MWSTLLDLHLHQPWSAALAALPALGNVAVLAYVLARLPHNRLTGVFSLFVLMLTVWQCYDVMVRLAGGPETSAAWRGMLRLGQQLAVPAGLHFALLFTGRERVAESPAYLVGTYGVALGFNSAYHAGLIHEQLVFHPVWGWMARENLGPVYTAEVVFNSTLALAMTAVLWWAALRGEPRERIAGRWLAAGITVPVAGGLVCEAVLPVVLGVRQIPITSSLMSAFSLAALVALTRHELFRVSTLSAARAVLETLTDALVILSSTGEVLFANPEAVQRFGHDKIGATMGSWFAPDAAGRYPGCPWARVLAGERLTGVEVQLRTVTSPDSPWLASMAPIAISRSGPPGVVVVLHDVGRLKDTQRALEIARDQAEEANRSKSLFLATMSHELRTPLNAVIGYSEILLDAASDAAVSRDLERIRQAGRQLLDLIDDILDLSKVESGRIALELAPFHAEELVQQIVPIGKLLCERNANRFDARLDAPVQILADRTRTRQILLNLIANAAKFTSNGEVALTVGMEPGWVLLQVSDTGIGMSSEQLSRLFGIFTQVHPSEREKYGGTGLGLALSRRLCQLMGGEISVRSEVGRGSTFAVRLPAA